MSAQHDVTTRSAHRAQLIDRLWNDIETARLACAGKSDSASEARLVAAWNAYALQVGIRRVATDGRG
jgi:hypothetical protein